MGGFEHNAVAVVGAGDAGIAAAVRALLEIDDTRPDGAPPVTVWLLDRGEAAPPADTPYPLADRSAADLHPFDTPEPAQGFPTFGEYVRQKLPEDPGLRGALPAPTYGHVDGYMAYVLEAALLVVRGKARLEVDRTRTLASIHENPRRRSAETVFLPATNGVIEIDRTLFERIPQHASGPVMINFTDGTSLAADEVILARHPPHMADLLQHLAVVTGAGHPPAWALHANQNVESRRGGPLGWLRDLLGRVRR
jgi:hypothetical protein